MKRSKKVKASPDYKTRRSALVTIICDAVLLLAFVASLLFYIFNNNVNTFNQNIENIANMASSDSELLQAALDNVSSDVKRAYNYCRGKTATEILDFLSSINNPNEEYQLLTLDEEVSTDLYHVYFGYSTTKTEGEYSFVKYENSSLAYSLFNHSARDEGEISYSQSFTNQTDALRYFSVFCSISVKENGKMQKHYLVKPQKENVVLDQIHNYFTYANISTAICYTDGKYLAHDDGYRADNFYDYLYKYNNLSIDEINEIKASVQNNEDGVGILTYMNHQKRECVFAYSVCGNSKDRIVIVSVPVSEFATEKLLSTFPLIIIGFLAVLLLFNIYRLLMIVRELRSSVAREQIANASKSSFLSRMSHEIRTPLNAVIGYNTIAKAEMSEAKDDAERRQAEMKVMDCLSKSEIASRHLLTVINDVLDMSAIEIGKIKIANDKFNFKNLITSLTTVFYTQAKSKGVDFEVLFDTLTDEWFIGDQMRINQVLTNLLSNAIKFTSEGGSVVLKINQSETDSDAAHINFKVTDTGIGMTPEYLSHIWTPFEQADSTISRRFGGSGLGLSITKNLVELMNGEISVTSIQGVGTTFSVDLTFEKTEQPIKTEAYDFSSINALIVDDDISTCDFVRLMFNRCGAKCATVNSGAAAVEAVAAAQKVGNDYSVCLVDWKMPQMDGIETIRRIRQITGDEIPIIVMTAYDYTEIADRAAEVGVNKFISKPLFQSSLFDLLANICGTKFSEPIEKKDTYNFSGVRVLLAEDNAMNMEIAITIMQSAGLIVDNAWNGCEVVKLFEASKPGTYSMILMDVHMPEMNGYEATQAIRSSAHDDAKTIPIVAMTADAFAENVAEAYSYGMNAHIAKPIDIPTLFETIKKYIH